MKCILRSYLDRVEPAVAIEGEANDVRGVLVPAGVDWVTHNVSSLREDLLDEDLLPTQGDPLAQVGCDTNHQAVARLCHPSLLALLLPALQLFDHGRQLVIACLLIQQVEVLYSHTHTEMREVSLHVDVILSAISVTNAVWVSAHCILPARSSRQNLPHAQRCATLRQHRGYIHGLPWWFPHRN